MQTFNRLRIPDEVSIYTDGSCNDRGYGGWAAVILCNNSVTEISDGCRETTNNKMELTAVLEALRVTPSDTDIVIYTDSRYVITGIENIFYWRDHNWITRSSTPVKNLELWQQFIEVISNKKSIKTIWVKGHNGSIYNERCDELAKNARDRLIQYSE